jgi:hypothetical protein
LGGPSLRSATVPSGFRLHRKTERKLTGSSDLGPKPSQAGLGQGQTSRITAAAGGTFRLAPPLSVALDGTSVIVVAPYVGKVLMVGNVLTNSTVVQIFGSGFDTIYAGNTLEHMFSTSVVCVTLRFGGVWQVGWLVGRGSPWLRLELALVTVGARPSLPECGSGSCRAVAALRCAGDAVALRSCAAHLAWPLLHAHVRVAPKLCGGVPNRKRGLHAGTREGLP